MLRIVIIGGVAGGMSAAARLRRLDEKAVITVLEKGAYVSYANCGLPYFIGGIIKERGDLLIRTPESLRERFNIDVRTGCEALSINRGARSVHAADASGEFDIPYDRLVISTGARPVIPPIPGITGPGVYTLRDIPDMDRIMEAAGKSRPGSAAVIGGGYIGLEMAENLKRLGADVTILEKTGHILPLIDSEMALIVQDHLKKNNIALKLGEEAVSLKQALKGVTIDLLSGESIQADMAVLSVGVKPDAKIAMEAGLETGKSGGIRVNEFLQTSDAYIYAVGDAIETYNPVLKRYAFYPLAGPANKQGRIAADNIIRGNKKTYGGTFGTAIVSVFGLAVAFTGASEQALDRDGIPHRTTIVHPLSHAGYYPGASTLSIKVMFGPEDGLILGAQAVGFEGADKSIDVISALMLKNGTVYDLSEFEQAYSPQFSSAKDPLNMAGFTAENMLESLVKPVYWTDLAGPDGGSFFILDVRTEEEYGRGSIPGAVNIPVDSLRERLGEVPPDKKIAVYCRVGFRGYLATRILMQNGFKDVYNLSGGYLTYSQAAGN